MKLPVISGQELIKILVNDFGCKSEYGKGDHIKIFRNLNEKILRTVVPLHRELKKGTLLNILKELEIKREELQNYL